MTFTALHVFVRDNVKEMICLVVSDIRQGALSVTCLGRCTVMVLHGVFVFRCACFTVYSHSVARFRGRTCFVAARKPVLQSSSDL